MKCDECHMELQVGMWPYCPHPSTLAYHPFKPYLDENISTEPVWITNPGDRNKLMRPHWENDNIVRIEERGKSETYYRQLNERRRDRGKVQR